MTIRFRPILFWTFAMFGAAMLMASVPSLLPAQDQPAAGEEQMSREERIRQHEKRVKEIIEERRRQQLERNKQAEPVPEAPAVVEEEERLPRLGRVILTTTFPIPDSGGRASDAVVRAGDRFVSDVILQNEGGTSFDRLTIALKYDKRFMKPLKIFDDEIRPYLSGPPEFERIDRDSVLIYKARLEKPRVAREIAVLRIAWEAIRPIEHTGINFVFASGDTELLPHTAVYQNDRNILGNLDDPIDGVLGSSLLIQKSAEEAAHPQMLQGKQEELRGIYLGAIGASSLAGLALQGPEEPVAAGEQFAVDVILNNPRGAIIDGVQFMVKFDPEVLEVVDKDRGNWMRRGVNAYDAPYRLDYPFDFHKRNEADNVRGWVRYSMGLGDALALPTGTFAQIHFRALKTVDQTEVALISGRQGAQNLTALTTFGFNIMTADPRLTQPIYSTAIVTESTRRQEVASAAAKADDEMTPPITLYLPGLFPSTREAESKLSYR